jgi:hypothetical protein
MAVSDANEPQADYSLKEASSKPTTRTVFCVIAPRRVEGEIDLPPLPPPLHSGAINRIKSNLRCLDQSHINTKYPLDLAQRLAHSRPVPRHEPAPERCSAGVCPVLVLVARKILPLAFVVAMQQIVTVSDVAEVYRWCVCHQNDPFFVHSPRLGEHGAHSHCCTFFSKSHRDNDCHHDATAR